MKDERASAR